MNAEPFHGDADYPNMITQADDGTTLLPQVARAGRQVNLIQRDTIHDPR